MKVEVEFDLLGFEFGDHSYDLVVIVEGDVEKNSLFQETPNFSAVSISSINIVEAMQTDVEGTVVEVVNKKLLEKLEEAVATDYAEHMENLLFAEVEDKSYFSEDSDDWDD